MVLKQLQETNKAATNFSSHDFHVTHAISAGDLGAFFYPPAHHSGWRAPIHQDTRHTFLEALSADLALCMAGRRHWDLRYYRCDALPRPSNQSTNQSKALSWEHEPIAWLCHSTCSNWTNLWYEVQPGIRNRYVGSNLHVSPARFCHSQFCSAGATSLVAFTCVPGLGIETWIAWLSTTFHGWFGDVLRIGCKIPAESDTIPFPEALCRRQSAQWRHFRTSGANWDVFCCHSLSQVEHTEIYLIYNMFRF